MNTIYLLITTFLSYKPNKSIRLIEDTKVKRNISLYTIDDMNIPPVKNLSREILYESFIAIDSIVFLVSVGVIKEKELENFLQKTVLQAKKLLIIKPEVRKFFNNFSNTVKLDNQYLKNMLNLRNKYFELDKSQIAQSITRDRILELDSRIQNKLVLVEDNKDKSYIRMIQALCKSKDGEDGLAVNLLKERFEFYRENIDLSKSQIYESKISLNLGGAIFSPALLLNLCKKLTIYKKKDLVKKTISSFLESIKILHVNTINRSFMDKKKQIIEYLISCLELRQNIYREKIDEAFYHRSILIEHFIRENGNDKDLYKTLDKFQEEEIKKLIFIFENMNEDNMQRVILHESRILEYYLNYLCDYQESTKNKLLDLFNV
ncbi:uncharacterized protein VNE69_02279 [Vairimorpha necatrix]|uniref:Uncharacterized protein n=1 Tax=Vairimorpha necatrix TaxID=6039 RepID=A0AAX4J9Y5_9MICR